jgi:magnesium transporter
MLIAHPPDDAGALAPHPGAAWLDLFNASESETVEIERLIGIDLPDRAELAGIEPSSRLSFSGGVLRLAGPVVAQADGDQPLLSQIGVILTRERLVTIRYDALAVFDHLPRKVDDGEIPPSGPAIFTSLMEAVVARLADLLETSRAHLDEVSHHVFRTAPGVRVRLSQSTAAMREKLQRLGRIGERISLIRETLLAIDRMIAFALEAAKDWFEPALDERLSGARSDIDSLNLFEEHLLGKVQFLLDAVLGLISIEQNDIFKVLTIASVVGIFPTLVAGWYGMNFANMPEYHWAFGYQFGIGAIALSTVLPLVWFKWRGWI